MKERIMKKIHGGGKSRENGELTGGKEGEKGGNQPKERVKERGGPITTLIIIISIIIFIITHRDIPLIAYLNETREFRKGRESHYLEARQGGRLTKRNGGKDK